jgi:hypothetical protein
MSVPITPGTGASSVAGEVVSGLNYQQIEVYGGGGASVLAINPDGSIRASIIGTPSFVQSGTVITSVSGTILTAYAPVASFVSGVTSVITSTSQTSITGTPAGGQRNYITHVLATNAAAVGTFVNLMDGPNVIYSGYAAASGGGFSATMPTPLRQANLTTSLDVKSTVQASVVVAVSGYTAP